MKRNSYWTALNAVLSVALGVSLLSPAFGDKRDEKQQKSAAVSSSSTSKLQATYDDIRATLGTVPGFLRAIPPQALPGAWNEMKSVQLSPDTALSPKMKELVGLAVAAQIPCTYCVYAHTEAARINGATELEIQEALAMAAITRHWSTVLNGSQTDLAAFKREADQMFRFARDNAAKSKERAGTTPRSKQDQGVSEAKAVIEGEMKESD